MAIYSHLHLSLIISKIYFSHNNFSSWNKVQLADIFLVSVALKIIYDRRKSTQSTRIFPSQLILSLRRLFSSSSKTYLILGGFRIRKCIKLVPTLIYCNAIKKSKKRMHLEIFAVAAVSSFPFLLFSRKIFGIVNKIVEERKFEDVKKLRNFIKFVILSNEGVFWPESYNRI